jgi:hypothetical protein
MIIASRFELINNLFDAKTSGSGRNRPLNDVSFGVPQNSRAYGLESNVEVRGGQPELKARRIAA